MLQVQLHQPVSIREMIADLQAMRAWHDDLYAVRYQGRVVKVLECGYCEACQAMAALEKAINQVSSSVLA